MNGAFKDIAIGLIEAICMERGLIKAEKVDGMPGTTLRAASNWKVGQLPITAEVENELKTLFSDEELTQLYDAVGHKVITSGNNPNLSGLCVSFSINVKYDVSEMKYHVPQNNDGFNNYKINNVAVYNIKDNGMNIAA